MKCCKKGHVVLIELIKDELVYDIKNTAYSFADSNIKSDTDNHELHNVFDVGENGNMDKLARILDSAVEDCKEVLYRYTKASMNGGGYETDDWDECVGDPCNDEDSYMLEMQVPTDFSQTSVHAMMVYIHDYVVYQSLYEWMLIVYPGGAEQFKVLAEEKKRKILSSTNHTSGKARIRLHPF